MRVVLGTNILVRANPKAAGSARSLLAVLARSPQHALILSPFLLEEAARVLAYPRLQAVWPLSPAEIQEYTAALDDLLEMVLPVPAPAVVISDPKDDPVTETALLGGADVPCTLDRHFYAPVVQDFLRHHSILVMNDVQLLLQLRGQ
jgi:predicted nucleic acid-binding protein